MNVKELRDKLKGQPDDLEVLFDDLKGGRIPVEDFRVERRVQFEKPGIHSKTSILVLSDIAMIQSDESSIPKWFYAFRFREILSALVPKGHRKSASYEAAGKSYKKNLRPAASS